jgi:hypothetical protein
VPKYARMVPYAEIEQNDYNLNLPRYIDSQAAEDLQDIAGHLQGGIPAADVNALAGYWRVLPQVKQTIFAALRPGYFDLAVEKPAIKQAIYAHPEFVAFTGQMNELFAAWRPAGLTLGSPSPSSALESPIPSSALGSPIPSSALGSPSPSSALGSPSTGSALCPVKPSRCSAIRRWPA